ncbi:MAG: glycosyltransferase family 2 protein [Planctomycetes bacterium]|jgi:GT2 family glycosyltransferase|nr:glycosyltransferase family 2 protein [Planctomycetota bacterium]
MTQSKSSISIVIVSFNVETLLKECLESLYRETTEAAFDIWVVDNHSRDNSVQMVKDSFPDVHLIENDRNLGFPKANNQAVVRSTSDYILLLNPDTIVRDGAIDKMVRFMDEHPDVGVSGCRVLNEDGSLQLACRRSIPTPRVAFYRLTGLSRLFPNSKTMARYNLTYLDPNEPHEVDAVSGAFLVIRKSVVDVIGVLDENFFIYGEDMDWCLRAKKAGWKVMYYPHAQILHYKGVGCKTNNLKTTYEFYRAMVLFHRKHFARECSLLTNLVVYIGIVLTALLAWRRWLFSAKPGAGK